MFVGFEWSADYRKNVGCVQRGERNIALINIVALARALKVRPEKLHESILSRKADNGRGERWLSLLKKTPPFTIRL